SITLFSCPNAHYAVFHAFPTRRSPDLRHGRLSYRTVYFEKHVTDGDYQGNPVINYSEESVPYTRVHEHKHFTPWETHEKTVYFKDRKSTRLNSSHVKISYAVFCLKKKN